MKNSVDFDPLDFDHMPLFLTVPQAASVLGIGRNNAYECVRSGAIRSVRLGKLIRIPKAALAELK